MKEPVVRGLLKSFTNLSSGRQLGIQDHLVRFSRRGRTVRSRLQRSYSHRDRHRRGGIRDLAEDHVGCVACRNKNMGAIVATTRIYWSLAHHLHHDLESKALSYLCFSQQFQIIKAPLVSSGRAGANRFKESLGNFHVPAGFSFRAVQTQSRFTSLPFLAIGWRTNGCATRI